MEMCTFLKIDRAAYAFFFSFLNVYPRNEKKANFTGYKTSHKIFNGKICSLLYAIEKKTSSPTN